MIRIAMAICATACCLSSAALAEVEHKPIEEKNLTRGRQTISPDKGYVFLHAPERVTMLLLKEPSAEEFAAFEAEWQTAFERAKRRYQRELQEWPEDVEFRRRAGR